MLRSLKSKGVKLVPTEKIWDYWAGRYEKLWVQKHSLGPTRQAILQAIAPLLTQERSINILDMGCGTGQLLREIQEQWPDRDISYLGVDAAPQMITVARSRSVGIEFQVSPVTQFNREERYDLITCSHSFPYYPDQILALQKLAALVKKDGWLLMAQTAENCWYDRLVTLFLKLTTSKANYPSVSAFKEMAGPWFSVIRTVIIKKRWYMPTIALFICRKTGEV